ncbi:glucan endo-1,3-beta-glucosidase [Fusarium bulbicola]|nr:glucan endo-1,3-beta-glucosidase [Fusarium bulbicola]
MRSILVSVALLAASTVITSHNSFPIHYRHSTLQGFTKANPGGPEDVEITATNLLIGSPSENKTHLLAGRGPDSRPLLVKLINNFREDTVKAYISGLDYTGKAFFVGPGGKIIYPNAKASRFPVEIPQNIAIPLVSGSEPLSMQLPSFIRSGRVYFSNDDLKFFVVDMGNGNSVVQPSVTNIRDPNAGLSWGFVELTYIYGLLYANISYVDFVGTVLGMALVKKDGASQVTAGLEAGSVTKICNDLMKQSKIDGRLWASLCVVNADGKPIRVLSPGNYHDINPRTFKNYWDAYVDDVWERFTEQDLAINTQSKAGMVKCRIIDGRLGCDGDESSFAKPVSEDIWGCNSGPFVVSQVKGSIHSSIIPRLCAGFVRSTLLIDGGNIQPSLGQQSYYTVNPTNHYSRIVHTYEADGRGYAFAYDDVNPDGDENASGVVSSDNVDVLTIHVGGPLPQ